MDNIIVVRGVNTSFSPEIVRAIDTKSGDFDLIRSAGIVIAIDGYEASVIKHPELEQPQPIAMVDLRQRAAEYREDGESLKVRMGGEARHGDVRTEQSGIPIRGITRVMVEDDVNSGRAVILRLRETEVEFPQPIE